MAAPRGDLPRILLAGLLDQLGYDQADVLGISWGYAARIAGELYGGSARIMRRLIPRSELHVYHGGHLELATDSGRLAAAVEAFLNTDLTQEGSQP